MSKTGKRAVLVTAAGGGIGKVIAQGFAEQGDDVLAADIDGDGLCSLHEESPQIQTMICDLGSNTDINALMDAYAAMPGDERILVNCVGIAGPIAPVEEISDADWQRTLDVNLTSIFRVIRRAVPMMKTAGRGTIVNIATLSVYLAPKNRLPYLASKAGLLGMTRGLAKELGPFDIRVNAILPGAVRGDRMRRVLETHAERVGRPLAELERAVGDYVALGDFVEPEDIAAAAIFLASPAAAKITGQELDVSGFLGWEE